jgi:hypothetical protein
MPRAQAMVYTVVWAFFFGFFPPSLSSAFPPALSFTRPVNKKSYLLVLGTQTTYKTVDWINTVRCGAFVDFWGENIKVKRIIGKKTYLARDMSLPIFFSTMNTPLTLQYSSPALFLTPRSCRCVFGRWCYCASGDT